MKRADFEAWKEKATADRKAWAEKWPNHCTVCEGHGGRLVDYDPSPAGVALSQGSMEDWEPCEECIDVCPRCSAPMDRDTEAICETCGWVEETPGHAMPEKAWYDEPFFSDDPGYAKWMRHS